MIILALLVGVLLIVSAIRGTQGTLFSALAEDVPGFAIWGAALVAVGAVGFIPGLKPVSRGLMALVIVVIVLNNYQSILDGFKSGLETVAHGTGTTKEAAPGGATQAATASSHTYGGLSSYMGVSP
jgi:hypothetical protein